MLQCEDCKRVSLDDVRGWVTLRFEPEKGEESVLLVYCPQCVELIKNDDLFHIESS